MKRVALSVVSAFAGYVLGVFAGYVLVDQLSSNTHDRSVEAAMTGAFLTGPIAAIIAFVVAMVYFRKKTVSPSP